nr:hydrolase or acyltransferase RutD [Raoultella sp. NCTC 9187]
MTRTAPAKTPARCPAAYSMATMAQELWQALEKAGITRFALVGHALGGLIGLQLALDKPRAVQRPGAG